MKKNLITLGHGVCVKSINLYVSIHTYSQLLILVSLQLEYVCTFTYKKQPIHMVAIRPSTENEPSLFFRFVAEKKICLCMWRSVIVK